MGGTEKKMGETKILKKGDKLGQGVGALKRGRLEPPYNLCFERLVNNGLVDHLEKFNFFSDFQVGFRSSQSTADLLTVVSDRIARAFNRPGVTRVVALDIF